MKVTRKQLNESIARAVKKVLKEQEEDFSDFGIDAMNRADSRDTDMDDIFNYAEDQFNYAPGQDGENIDYMYGEGRRLGFDIAPSYDGRHLTPDGDNGGYFSTDKFPGFNAMNAMEPEKAFARKACIYNAAAPFYSDEKVKLPDDFLQQINENKIRKAVRKSIKRIFG